MQNRPTCSDWSAAAVIWRTPVQMPSRSSKEEDSYLPGHWASWYGVESADIGYAEQADLLRLVRSGGDLANACADAVAKLQGRGFVLAGTLGELEWCRSAEAGLPVASTNPTFALLPGLHSDTSRRIIGGFCD